MPLFFAMFMAVWATALLKAWTRRANKLSMEWGTIHREQAEVVRKQFKGKPRVSPITNQTELHYPEWRRGLKCASSRAFLRAVSRAFSRASPHAPPHTPSHTPPHTPPLPPSQVWGTRLAPFLTASSPEAPPPGWEGAARRKRFAFNSTNHADRAH